MYFGSFYFWKFIPEGKQEILGTLFQQTAKYVIDHGEEVTKEEREAINVILDYDTLADRYSIFVQDPVKFQSPLCTEYGIQKINKKEFDHKRMYRGMPRRTFEGGTRLIVFCTARSTQG